MHDPSTLDSVERDPGSLGSSERAHGSTGSSERDPYPTNQVPTTTMVGDY